MYDPITRIAARLAEDPNDGNVAYLMAQHYSRYKEHYVALEWYQRALRTEPRNAVFMTALGNCMATLGHLEDAKQAFTAACRLDPFSVSTLASLGAFYEKHLRQPELAMDKYRAAIAMKPLNSKPIEVSLARCILQDRSTEEAVSCFKQCTGTQCLILDVFSSALMQLGRYGEARLLLYNALGDDQCNAVAWSRIGDIAVITDRDINAAISSHRRALAIEPDLIEAAGGYISDFRMIGDYERARHEHRRFRHLFPPLTFRNPTWNGELLAGRRIVLRCESGYGDTLLFSRFTRFLEQQGATVTVKAPRALLRLLADVEGIHELVSWDEESPPADFECPIESLGAHLNLTTGEVGCNVPYLTAPRSTAPCLAIESGNQRRKAARVGVVWQGAQIWNTDRYRFRSIPASDLCPLLELDGVIFFSLQTNRAADRWPGAIANESSGDFLKSGIVDLAPNIKSFFDTASFAMSLDLILTIDTAMAHLAGGLGRPTWVMLPFSSSWHWLLNAPKSPFYPTTRLFRQAEPGDWKSVVLDVKNALRELDFAVGG